MACNGDYMNPSEMEKNLSIVYGLLDELKNGELPLNFGDGYDDRIYNKNLRKEHLYEKTRELCEKLQNREVSGFSLEMRLWWRKHQAADKERIEKEVMHVATQEERQKALLKLSDYERKLLGIS